MKGQRVSDEALEKLSKNEVIHVFPKSIARSKSSLVLISPKTDESARKLYLTAPLLKEIAQRIEEIKSCKDYLRDEYQDQGLLICFPDGRLYDPKSLQKFFKEHQCAEGVAPGEHIQLQGLRKSGQMHKVRITGNNYQLVAENGGQSPEVLISNYNEALDEEKRSLAKLVEGSFYPSKEKKATDVDNDMARMMKLIKQKPDFGKQLLQNLLQKAL